MLKRNLSSVAVSIAEVIVGILILVNPIGFTSGIIIAFGVVLLVWLYLTSFALILGAEFNAVLSDPSGDSLFEKSSASLC